MVREHDHKDATHRRPPERVRRGKAGIAVGVSAARRRDAFHTTVELAPSGICHIDLAGRFLYVNPALCQMLGYPREQLLALTVSDVTPPDDRAETLDLFGRLVAGEVPAVRRELRYCRQDGSEIWVQVSATLRYTPVGAPQYAIAVIEDISERKRLEEQLRAATQWQALAYQESQQRANDLAATFEAISDLVIVFDEAGNVQRVNRAIRDFMGQYPTLAAGRQQLGLVDTEGRPMPPEQWVSARVLRGETVTGAQTVDMLAQHAGGQMQFSISGAPVLDAEGRITGGVIVMRDVTERRQLERRTEETLRTLLQMAETLVAPLPEQTIIASPASGSAEMAPTVNPVVQRLAELSCHVLGCQHIGIIALERERDVMHPLALAGLPPEVTSDWLASLEGLPMTEFVGADGMRSMRAGSVVMLDLERQPLCSVAQCGPVALAMPLRLGTQLVGCLALSYEQEPHTYTEDELALEGAVAQLAALIIQRERLLSEREEARANELALREANRRMYEFLSIASHELRTPLTTLLGNLQVLERRLARTSVADRTEEDLTSQLTSVRSALESMERQGWQLSRIISDMVDASRIKTGQLEFWCQPCDLATIVHEVTEEQRQAQPDRTIELTLPAGGEVPIVADASRISQVVTNYLTNALKYSPEDEPVEVRLAVEGDTARVTVRDHGPGLPPEEQAQIWELFYRVPGVEVQSGSGVGLGLGLHICKTVIERHSGRVGIDSAVGQGATFWFAVPLATKPGAEAPACAGGS
jgi:PAS domain S-box-containing protein